MKVGQIYPLLVVVLAAVLVSTATATATDDNDSSRSGREGLRTRRRRTTTVNIDELVKAEEQIKMNNEEKKKNDIEASFVEGAVLFDRILQSSMSMRRTLNEETLSSSSSHQQQYRKLNKGDIVEAEEEAAFMEESELFVGRLLQSMSMRRYLQSMSM